MEARMPSRFIIRYPLPHRSQNEFSAPASGQPAQEAFAPPTDVFETPEDYRVRVEIAGVDPADVEIMVAEDHRTVTIQGDRPPAQHDGPGRYLNIEVQYGPFARTIVLPDAVSGEDARASYAQGYLSITLPRLRPQSSRRSVPIQTK
jgi:HSP20 family protein